MSFLYSKYFHFKLLDISSATFLREILYLSTTAWYTYKEYSLFVVIPSIKSVCICGHELLTFPPNSVFSSLNFSHGFISINVQMIQMFPKNFKEKKCIWPFLLSSPVHHLRFIWWPYSGPEPWVGNHWFKIAGKVVETSSTSSS